MTRTAFQRWRSGDNTPDPAYITPLLKALPDEERERLHALMMDYPKARALLSSECVQKEANQAAARASWETLFLDMAR